jgi:hypothetical protein
MPMPMIRSPPLRARRNKRPTDRRSSGAVAAPRPRGLVPTTAWRPFNAATFALLGKVVEQSTLTAQLHRVIDALASGRRSVMTQPDRQRYLLAKLNGGAARRGCYFGQAYDPAGNCRDP